MKLSVRPLFLSLCLLLGLLGNTAFAAQPVNPELYRGKPIQAYPKLMLVQETKYIHVYWAGRSDCEDFRSLDPNTIVAQDEVRELQRRIVEEMTDRIEKLEAKAKRTIPEWKARVSDRLYPIDVHIELEMPIACSGADIRDYIKVDGVPQGTAPYELFKRPVINAGGKIRPGEELSLMTIKMHELGHLLLRALGYPRFVSTSNILEGYLEETFADFIGSYTNDFTPYIGEGLGQNIIEEYQEKLKSPDLDVLRLASIQSILRAASQRAIRDFTKPLQYPDIYLLPEAHHISAHVNSVLHKMGNVIGPERLFELVLPAFALDLPHIMSADVSDFVSYLITQYAIRFPNEAAMNKSKIQTILQESGWFQKIQSNSPIQVSVSQKPDGSQFIIDLALPSSALSRRSNRDLAIVNFTLYADRGRAVVAYADYFNVWHPRIFLKKTNTCHRGDLTCLCTDDFTSLSVDAVFSASDGRIARTSKIELSQLRLDSHSCYSVAVGNE